MTKSCLIFSPASLVISWVLETFQGRFRFQLYTNHANIKIVHEARLLWRVNLTRKRLTTVILLLVHKDFPFLDMFPTGTEGECLFIDRSTYIYYTSWPSCPDSVHVYIKFVEVFVIKLLGAVVVVDRANKITWLFASYNISVIRKNCQEKMIWNNLKNSI